MAACVCALFVTFPRPTIAAVTPETVPVNVGLARGARSAAAVVVSYPGTVGVPVKVGLASGA
jgi:hypothetical protein